MKHFKFTEPMRPRLMTEAASCLRYKPAVPVEYIDSGVLERNAIDVVETAETIEIVLKQNASELSLTDKSRVRGFVRSYVDHGHGPLVMLLPEGTPNQQFAVGAIAEARAIAFENGVAYEEISGGSKFGAYPSVILSFKAYDAVAPDCKSFGQVDVSSTRNNNDLPNLGCSVRRNIAAMIADPADLLGTRELDPADVVRRNTVLQAYRAGEQTASERNDGENGAISDAINDQ